MHGQLSEIIGRKTIRTFAQAETIGITTNFPKNSVPFFVPLTK